MPSLFDSNDFNDNLFFPRADRSLTPPGARELMIPVEGAQLHLRWHRAPSAALTVLLFHGNGEIVSDYDTSAARFAALGASLAVVDYRGYGRSTGTPSLRSCIRDAGPVIESLLAQEGAAPVVVMGRSLGSACAAELYQAPPEGVPGFVLESGSADLHALIRRRGMEPPASLSQTDLEVFDPLLKLARGTRPLLVLHGAEDDLIAPREARRAFDAAGTRDKRLQLIPGRGHNDLSWSPGYWDAVGAFLAGLIQTPTQQRPTGA